MNEDSTILELVEEWLEGKLNNEEKLKFESRLETDKEFALEVTRIKDMITSIEYSGQENIRKTIKNIETKLESEKFFKTKNKNIVKMESNKKRNNSKIWMAIAASFIIIGALFMFNNNSDNKDNGDLVKVFEKYNKPENTVLPKILDRIEAKGLADADKDAKDSLATALKLFESYKYKEAKTVLYKYLEVHPQDKTAQLYMGLTLFSMAKYGKASKYLMPLSRDNDFKFINTAKWYLALSFTQFGSESAKNKAIELMKDLASTNTKYQVEANDYLQYFD